MASQLASIWCRHVRASSIARSPGSAKLSPGMFMLQPCGPTVSTCSRMAAATASAQCPRALAVMKLQMVQTQMDRPCCNVLTSLHSAICTLHGLHLHTQAQAQTACFHRSQVQAALPRCSAAALLFSWSTTRMLSEASCSHHPFNQDLVLVKRMRHGRKYLLTKH